jgi:hypothetical protein
VASAVSAADRAAAAVSIGLQLHCPRRLRRGPDTTETHRYIGVAAILAFGGGVALHWLLWWPIAAFVLSTALPLLWFARRQHRSALREPVEETPAP